MKTVVIYKSKTGFTKKYAEWIAKALLADIFDVSKVDINVVTDYDTVIYGGSLYAVGIIGVKYITQNLNKLKGKKIVVFATGASPSSEGVISEVKNKNFTLEEQKHVQFFYLRGGFDYSKIKLLDKVLMTLLKWKIKMKKELTPEARGMLAMYDNPVDFTRKKNIDEIITYVNL
ncbi:flavodoxin domain-containing protein [Clostridium frigoris]|uniref:Flavodoxin domain-containing protein n=1 Tax=Clostridium frigoris TaxID=205327 RepID=A0ABS6BRU5_9CLOT|nr:flavodoxin domain-containing protein [Clostridium frigoris]MBU3159195.1 flavodoxin domain-containing protein [Clostridium frigoris]